MPPRPGAPLSTLAKLVLTPLLIAAATLAGRRWGHAAGGFLAGLPMTSGPVSVFLTVEQGPAFAATAAVGTLLGLISLAAFSLVYGWTARRARWPASAAAGAGAFTVASGLLTLVHPSAWAAFAVTCLVLGLVAWALRGEAPPPAGRPPDGWDLPLRMTAATLVVLALTAGAPALGPSLAGLLSPFPVFGLTLAAFAHRADGGQAAARVLRGMVVGSFGFATFGLLVALGLERWGPWATYLGAATATLAVNAAFVSVGRQRARGRQAPEADRRVRK